MSKSKALILKIAVLGLIIWGGSKWVGLTPERSAAMAVTTETAIDTTLDKTGAVLNASGEGVDGKVGSASDAWERADLKGKVNDLQDEAKPIGKVIKNKVDPNKIPGVKATSWLNGRTSFAAILLFFVGGSMLFLMGFAGPSSLSGGRD